ncbi:MAG: hypothetical protein GXX95_10230 [Methanomassiliicoccus sp.]|nr:hypothetical protein [Methanomassiliicoccus sp.]
MKLGGQDLNDRRVTPHSYRQILLAAVAICRPDASKEPIAFRDHHGAP